MDQQGEPGAAHPARPDRLRTAPPGVLPHYLVLEATAVVLPFAVPSTAPTAREWPFCAILLGTAVVQTELSAKAERMQRFLAGNPHVSVSSVWFFAATLSTPPALASVLTVLIHGHLWLRMASVPGARLYRLTCSVATCVVTIFAARGAADLAGLGTGAPGEAATVAAGLTFFLVNTLLVMIGCKLHEPARPLLSPAGSVPENVLDAATLCLGAAAAVLPAARPWLVPLLVLPLVLLRRGELGRRLELQAGRDPKTGVLTIAEWRARAEAELGRAARIGGDCGILMLDLDHFKRVNDTHGHLAGDDVLRAVAGAVQGEARIYDSVGRCGGEEFVVLLPGLGRVHSVAVAERIRDTVAGLTVVAADGTKIAGLSVSIGVAVHPAADRGVDEVLGAADKAVYEAKNSGRDRVCVSRGGIARTVRHPSGSRASPDGAAW
ncbi:GGDEF domain-containing protein [Amycolatopsis mongoliensis]|uniref:GGDEF domain-containing protein n=1 Tax=Amycolatopsis mongoliensis TaxID=715475 RepID=A0A9Y2NHX4_9PSEU|nr:GGDEF domain-containing protein [Amycolatopsis sp. 4-36]WIY00153.1 GGDEF domain-containing protein [Amycolatopsis sp. 4-36]